MLYGTCLFFFGLFFVPIRSNKVRQPVTDEWSLRNRNFHVLYHKMQETNPKDKQIINFFASLPSVASPLLLICWAQSSGKAKYTRSGLLWVPFWLRASLLNIRTWPYIAIKSGKSIEDKKLHWNLSQIFRRFSLQVFLKTCKVFPVPCFGRQNSILIFMP